MGPEAGLDVLGTRKTRYIHKHPRSIVPKARQHKGTNNASEMLFPSSGKEVVKHPHVKQLSRRTEPSKCLATSYLRTEKDAVLNIFLPLYFWYTG